MRGLDCCLARVFASPLMCVMVRDVFVCVYTLR